MPDLQPGMLARVYAIYKQGFPRPNPNFVGPRLMDSVPITQSILPPPFMSSMKYLPESGEQVLDPIEHLIGMAKSGVVNKGIEFARKGYKQATGKDMGTFQDFVNAVQRNIGH